jgi:hypothetical protein
MPRAGSVLSWSTALENYVLSGSPSEEDRSITPESPAWFAWLAEQSSFAFHGKYGSYTARLEIMQRGERYWYAYRRTDQKLSKKYLGKTADLTIDRLEQVAGLLHPERAGSVLPDTARPPRKAHNAPERTSQIVTPVPVQKTMDRPAPAVKGHTATATAMPARPLPPLLSTKLYVPRLPAGWCPAPASSSACGRGSCKPSSWCVPRQASAKPPCWSSVDCPPPGSPLMQRTTTRSASSPLYWPHYRRMIPRLGQACRHCSPPHTGCKGSPSLPSSRC